MIREVTSLPSWLRLDWQRKSKLKCMDSKAHSPRLCTYVLSFVLQTDHELCVTCSAPWLPVHTYCLCGYLVSVYNLCLYITCTVFNTPLTADTYHTHTQCCTTFHPQNVKSRSMNVLSKHNRDWLWKKHCQCIIQKRTLHLTVQLTRCQALDKYPRKFQIGAEVSGWTL